MSVVATPSVHALLRDFVAGSPRRTFLPDAEGIELSNQASLMREVVVTVQACLTPDLAAIRAAERREHADDPHWAAGPGLHLIAAVTRYEELLATLLDAATLIEAGRMTTAWTLLGSAADAVRTLAALDSSTGTAVARRLAATSAEARARFADAAAADDVDLGLAAAFDASGPGDLALDGSPVLPPEVADLIDLVGLGARTSCGGGPLDVSALYGDPYETDYGQLATVGGYQTHLVLEMIRAATDALCGVAYTLTADEVWAQWSEDVRTAVEFAWDCV